MGEDAYKKAFEEGARLDLDEASALALGRVGRPGPRRADQWAAATACPSARHPM